VRDEPLVPAHVGAVRLADTAQNGTA